MGFWTGLMQGVEDVAARKEKKALADERQGVRDEATARYNESIDYRDRMQQITDDRNALIEGRAVEAHGVAMATAQFNIGQKIDGLAGGTGGGNRTGGGGGTVPTPQAMEAGQRALQARIDGVGGLDDMSASQQTYYKSILGNVAASYELNNMLEAAVGDDQDLTVLTAVDRVRMVAVVAAQGQEAFAEFNRTAAEDGWDATEVAEAMQLAQSVNPAFAELVMLTPSQDNLTEQEQFSTFEAGLQFRAAAWAKANGETQEFTTAMSQLQGTNLQERNEGVATLIGMGVGQDWIHANTKPGNPLYDLAPPPVSAVPTVNADGALVSAGSGTAPADIPSFATEADVLALPVDDQAALVGQRVTIGGVTGVMEGVPAGGSVGAPKSLSEPYKEYGESRQAVVVPELQDKYSGEFGQAGAQKVAETAWTVLQKTGEYMLKGADRGAGVALGSANEVGSWLGVGLGFMNEAMGLDGTAMFQAAGELDDVAGKLFDGGISSSDAAQKLADMWRESLTREGGDVSAQMGEGFGDYNVTIPTREEINEGSTPEGAAIKEAINALVSEVQKDSGRNLDSDNLIGFDPGQTPLDDRIKSDRITGIERGLGEAELQQTTRSEGYRPTQMGPTELNLPKVLEALSTETRKAVEAELQTMPEEVARSEGYRPVQIGATELNLPKVLGGLSAATMKLVESDLQAFSEQPTRSEGYRPTQMGPTELNLPKILEALTPETRKIVEAELQSSSAGQGTATLDRQSSMLSEDLNDVARSTGASENLSTDRSAGPQMAIQDLNPDDLVELEAGVEEVIKAIVDGADQGNIEVLVRELNAKFTPEIVGVAIQMAMGSNQ